MTDNTVAGHEEQPGRALAGLLRNWWESSARDGREKPTQQSLAKRLGIDQTTLSRYLNPAHASNAPSRIVEQLHTALRAPADDLDRALALARAAAAGKRPAAAAAPGPAAAPTGPSDDRDAAARRRGRSPVAYPALAVASLLLLVLGGFVWWLVPTTTGQSDAKGRAGVSDRPSEGTDWPLARKGDVFWKARTVRLLLRANGFDVKVDADYGPATAQAVKKFQAAHGLTPDGKVGKDTWPLLVITVDSRTTEPDAITAVQYLLHHAGAPTDSTGTYTPSTRRSLKEFQESRNLPVTGVGDEATWRALLNAQGPDQHK